MWYLASLCKTEIQPTAVYCLGDLCMHFTKTNVSGIMQTATLRVGSCFSCSVRRVFSNL